MTLAVAAPRAARPTVVTPLLAGTAIAATAAFLLVHDALIDDAYITLGYARNVGLHLHWGLIPTETANSATSPLNVLLLAVAIAVVRDGIVAVGVVFVAAVVLAAFWLDALAREVEVSRVLPYVGAGLLLADPLTLSTVGLEPFLCLALVTGLLRYGAAGRRGAYGVVTGLLALARPDVVVFAIVGALVFPGVRRGLPAAVGAAVAVALPWYVFSWFALGSALPDTLILKTSGETWGGRGFWAGPGLYQLVAPRTAALTLLPVAAGALVLAGLLVARVVRPWEPWQRAAAVAGLGAAAHYGVYGLLGTAPFHWYYAPAVIGTTLCAAIATCRTQRAPALLGLGLALALAVLSLADDLAQGVPWVRAPLSSNWALAAEYTRMGTDLRGIVGTRTVESPGEIGTIAYACDCAVVDAFSDRGRVLGAIAAREASSDPVTRWLLELNYTHLDRTQRPLPVDLLLRYEAKKAPSGPQQWPGNHWTAGPGRFVLIPGGKP